MNDLTKGSIKENIFSLYFPSSVGLIFSTLYNMVDTYFAGRQISKTALAGMTLASPIYYIVIATSAGIGGATNALCSIALGKKDNNYYHRVMKNALFLGVLIYLFVMLLDIFVFPFAFKALGATTEQYEYGSQYISVICYGFIFSIIFAISNSAMIAQGTTKPGRNVLIIGFFLNIILDPLFIIGPFGFPKLGVLGIALSTVVSQAVSCIYIWIKLMKSSTFSWDKLKKVELDRKIMKDILHQSIPGVLNFASVAMAVFVINYYITSVAPGDYGIAGYGAGRRVEQFALIPTLGLGTATMTVAAQNFGAKNRERVIETARFSLKMGLIIIAVGMIVLFPLKAILVSIFSSDPEVIKAGADYMRIEIFVLPTYVILTICTSVLQAIKKPNFAMFIGPYRQIIMPLIVFYILCRVLEFGLNGIWLGILIVNWSAAIIAMVFTYKKLKNIDFKSI